MSSKVYPVDSPDLVKEVQNYEPVPYGWPKLLAWLLVPMTGTAVLVYTLVQGEWFFLIIVAGFYFLAGMIVSIERTGVRDYLSRNVRGWKLVCWRDGPRFFCQLVSRGRDPDTPPLRHRLSLPLGGWWLRTGGLFKVDKTVWIRDLFFNAKMSIAFLNVMRDPKSSQSSVWLQWQDRNKNQLPIRMDHALEQIWELWVDTGPHYYDAPDMSLRGLLYQQQVELQITRSQLEAWRQTNDKVAAEHNRVAEQRNRLLERLDRLVGELADTTRLGPSKEGKILRQELERDLVDLAPVEWPRRAHFEIAVARQKHGPSGGQQIEAT